MRAGTVKICFEIQLRVEDGKFLNRHRRELDHDRLSQVAVRQQQIVLSETMPDTNRRSVQRGWSDDIVLRYNVTLSICDNPFDLPDQNL